MSVAPCGYAPTSAVLTHAHGLPTTADALLFWSARSTSKRRSPKLCAGFHVVSIGAAIGTAALIAIY